MRTLERLQSILFFWRQRAVPYPVRILAEDIACEEFLEVIFDQAPFGIYTLNSDGVIDSFNREMVGLAGAKNAKEVIGLNALTLPTYKGVGLTEYFRAGLQGRAFELPAVKYVSYTGQKTSYRFYRGVPVFAKSGKVSKLVLFVTDVTEKVEIEATARQLKSAKEHYQSLASILENSFEGVMTVGSGFDQIIRYVNPAWEKATGWSRDEVVDKLSPRILKSGNQDTEFYKNLWDTITAGKTFRAEIVNKRRDGSFYNADIVIFPIKDEKGETVYVEISRDITERKQKEEQLRKRTEELERMNRVLTGRELKMIELKKEIAELKKRLGESAEIFEQESAE